MRRSVDGHPTRCQNLFSRVQAESLQTPGPASIPKAPGKALTRHPRRPGPFAPGAREEPGLGGFRESPMPKISFREPRTPEAQFPGITLLGFSVNRGTATHIRGVNFWLLSQNSRKIGISTYVFGPPAKRHPLWSKYRHLTRGCWEKGWWLRPSSFRWAP